MSQFQSGMLAYLEEKEDSGERMTVHEKKMLRVLRLPKNNRLRNRELARLEKVATDKLRDDGHVGAIDWGSINWEKLFAQLLAFIKAILALFAVV